MSKIDDGGSAFPYAPACDATGIVGVGNYEANIGMSLRDWFAGQCIGEMIHLSMDRDGGWEPSDVATGCYNLADAMIAARKGEALR